MDELIQSNEARVNVTYAGQNGELPDPVQYDSTDGDVKGWVSEAVAGGNISQGDRLKVDAAGKLVVASTADDLSVAIARGDAVLDDVFGVYVETLRIHA